jgi:hypothetical protein
MSRSRTVLEKEIRWASRDGNPAKVVLLRVRQAVGLSLNDGVGLVEYARALRFLERAARRDLPAWHRI